MSKNFDLKGPAFVGLRVRDVNVSADFYEKTLGLRRASRWKMKQCFVYSQAVIGRSTEESLMVSSSPIGRIFHAKQRW